MMARILQLCSTVMLGGALAACGAVTQVEYRNMLVTPSDSQIADCVSEPPPDKAEYIAATEVQREAMLVAYASKQTLHIQSCNIRLDKLRIWKKEQTEIFAKAPK